MCEMVRYHDAKSMIGFFSQLCVFLTNCFVQSVHNFKFVRLIDHTTLWQEFMMHHAIAIEENSEQNVYIWPNLTGLDLLDTSIEMIRLWFQCHSYTPIIRHQLWPFWANLHRRWTSSISSEWCPCDVGLP